MIAVMIAVMIIGYKSESHKPNIVGQKNEQFIRIRR